MFKKMITDNIKQKIEEIFRSTSDSVVGVGLSTKTKNGVDTGEECIGFRVLEKKPIDQLKPEEIIPKEIIIDGVIFKTDVCSTGIILPLSCNSFTLNNCYSNFPGTSTSLINRTRQRPLIGGISITSEKNIGSVGTLGVLVLDNKTDALLALTNLHVIVDYGFHTGDINSNWILPNNTQNDIYQNGEEPFLILSNPQNYKVGEMIRYQPLNIYPLQSSLYNSSGKKMIWETGYPPPSWINRTTPVNNSIDAALFSVEQITITYSYSSGLLGLTGSEFMPFASTAEIDSTLMNAVFSSGRSSGLVFGTSSESCGIKVKSIGVSVLVPFDYQVSVEEYNNGLYTQSSGFTWSAGALFDDCIEVVRIDENCEYPFFPGDSGSCVVADFSGTYKIIGILFAGSSVSSYLSRIDNIARILDIKAWTGQTASFVTGKTIISLPGTSFSSTASCFDDIYWQVGLGTFSIPCISTTTTTTSTSTSTTTLAPGVSLIIGTSSGCQGDLIRVPFYIESDQNVGVGALSLIIEFDSGILPSTCSSVEACSFENSINFLGNITTNFVGNQFIYSWFDFLEKNVSGNLKIGDILVYTAGLGSYSVNWDILNIEVSDADGNPILVNEYINSQINIDC